MVIKGQNFRMKISGKVIACATSCTIHKSADLEETSSKDSTNSYKEQEVVSTSWDGSVDALALLDASGDAAAFQVDSALDLVGTTVDVEFVQTNGEKNRVEVENGLAYYGKAIVNDCSQTWANKSNGTYTLQFQGSGVLTKGHKPASSGT